MKRGPIIHGVLLVAVLIFSYMAWTEEEKADRKTGDIAVWSIPAADITAITYDTKDRTIRLEQRGEAGDRYLWGIDTRTIRKPTPPKPKPPAKPEDDHAHGAEGAEGAEEPAEPETETKIREFAVGENGDQTLENLAQLYALRDLGKPSADDAKEYGLEDSKDVITVFHTGGTHSLTVGGKVYGGADRYVLGPDSSKAYVIAGEVLKDVIAGESGLRLRDVHRFEDEEVGKAVVTVGDKKRTLVNITVENDKGKKSRNWADATAPDKPDQTMSNFLQNIGKLRPSQYEADVDGSQMNLIVKVEYFKETGEQLGWLELYEKPAEPEPEPEPEPAGDDGQTAPGGADPAAPAQPATGPAGQTGKDAAGKDAAAPKPAAGKDEAAGAKPAKPKPKPPQKPTYYIRTEATRSFATASASIATRITEDIAQIFTE